MTSRHCFSRTMREDLRHKMWMVALSVLGNLLALPVLYLLYTGQAGDGMEKITDLNRQINGIASFFRKLLPVSAGIIAVAGALIVGLAGFRYVFYKNRTDTYHSIPVKRRTLFLTGWLNGLLVWLIPFLVSLLATGLLAGTKLVLLSEKARTLSLPPMEGGAEGYGVVVFSVGEMLEKLFCAAAVVFILFLLVYHLTLLAVMLCGNILNTLVTLLVLGVGGIAVYFLIWSFFDLYLDTFLSTLSTESIQWIFHLSPLADALYLLLDFCSAEEQVFRSGYLGSLAVAGILGVLAFIAYQKRPSELAGQGLKNRLVKILIQLVASLCAAMGGWLVFWMITEEIVWSVFGTLLVGILTFGILEIVFSMEFRAFFRHKLEMATVLAAGLLIGFGFYGDWIGYDTYLPDKEEIAEISIYSDFCTNITEWKGGADREAHINKLHIQDAAAAYAFLETAVAYTENGLTEEISGQYPYDEAEWVTAKVVLKNGRSYYRGYRVSCHDNQAALALLSSPEYMELNYVMEEEVLSEITDVRLSRSSGQIEFSLLDQKVREHTRLLIEAYNQDVRRNPAATICGEGRLLCAVVLRRGHTYVRYLDVYDFMENTREVLRQMGYAEYADPIALEELDRIEISAYVDSDDSRNPLSAARNTYGVYGQAEASAAEESLQETADYDEKMDYIGEVTVTITETEQLEELLSLLSYKYPHRGGGAFQNGFGGNIILVYKDGTEQDAPIAMGTLPEKYVRMFAEIDLQEEGK